MDDHDMRDQDRWTEEDSGDWVREAGSFTLRATRYALTIEHDELGQVFEDRVDSAAHGRQFGDSILRGWYEDLALEFEA